MYRRRYSRARRVRRRFMNKWGAKSGRTGWQKFKYAAGKTLNFASKALKVAHSVKNLINVEWKRKDTSSLGGAVGNVSPSTIGGMCVIAQGTDYNQRNGNQVLLKQFGLKGTLLWNSNSTTQRVRIVIVMQKNAEDPSTYIDMYGAGLDGFRYVEDKPKSRIIFSRLYILDVNHKQYNITFFKKFYKTHMKWDPNHSTTSPKYNDFSVLARSNDDDNKPTFVFNTRVTYIDN
ncbi:MAG: capsid protein [CRESS virus sp. ctBNR11]|nr:MAG: capsid protein [CRESS virus sp. ctBNR11]